jgi:hypothetical protein
MFWRAGPLCYSMFLTTDPRLRAQDGYVFNSANQKVPLAGAAKQEDIKSARTAWELYQHINEDCWVVLHIKSATREGKQMEGTRLTLVRLPFSAFVHDR